MILGPLLIVLVLRLATGLTGASRRGVGEQLRTMLGLLLQERKPCFVTGLTGASRRGG